MLTADDRELDLMGWRVLKMVGVEVFVAITLSYAFCCLALRTPVSTGANSSFVHIDHRDATLRMVD